MESLVTAVEVFLRKNLTRILSDLKTDKVTAKEAAKALGGLESAMEDAGLSNYFERAKGLFRDTYEQVQEEFEGTTGRAALLGKFTRQNLDALMDDRLKLASSYVTDYLGDVRAAVLDTVIGGRTVKPEEILATAEGRTLNYLKTELNTSLMAYQRVTHLEKAKKAGITKFLYVGPLDDVTRPFCEERVNKVWSVEEVESWDNGTDLPAAIYCGGYNCRHHLRPVSDELAEELQAEAEEEEA